MIRLIQEFGTHVGRQVTFDRDRIRIGRVPGNEVAFDPKLDLDSSGYHCEILYEHGAYIIIDLQSRNGTFVNGMRVQQQRLQYGDVIECGRSGPRLRVEIAQGPAVVAQRASLGRNLGVSSVGAAVAAALPAGAQVGRRTMAMMIDTAVAQVIRTRSTTGLKVAMALTIATVLCAISAGTYVIFGGRLGEKVASAVGPSPGEYIGARYENAVYLLAVARSVANPQGFCTGFAVTYDLIATNAHCIEVAQEAIGQGNGVVALRNNGRGAQTAVVAIYRDPRFHNPAVGLDGSGFDVGLMRVGVSLPVSVRLASVDEALRVRPGAHIYVYGFPGLTMNEVSPVATLTEGVLNRTTDFFDRGADPQSAQKVQHTAQTTSGSSGSPIFLSSGVVIGVNAGSLADEERQSVLDPRSGHRVSVEINRSSNFKYGMRADLIRQAIQTVGETAP